MATVGVKGLKAVEPDSDHQNSTEAC